MLSFSPITDNSVPIALIHNKRNDNLIYLTPDADKTLSRKLKKYDYSEESCDNSEEETNDESSEDKSTFKKINLDDYSYSQRFSIIPNIKGSDKIYIAAPSGAGKTTLIGDYVSYYIKLFPEKKIFLFSDVNHDEILDKYTTIQRIKLDDAFLERNLHPEEISDSLCIFDDIDSTQNKKILKVIQTLRDSVLMRGRHEGISHVIITNHLLTDYKNTRVTLNEMSMIILFPSAGAPASIKYVLKNYVGLEMKQIKSIKKLNSRWLAFKMTAPQVMISENKAIILNQLE